MHSGREPSTESTFRRSSTLDDFAAARGAMGHVATSGRHPRRPVPEPRGSLTPFVLAGIAGVVLCCVGFGLGIAAFGETYMERHPDRAWEDAGGIGMALFFVGLVLVGVGTFGGVARATRGAKR